MHATFRLAAPLAPLALLLAAGPLAAQTVTVTTGDDTVDVDWQTATVADLPGPDGRVSLSEALIATNHTPGHQTIAFAIPQAEWKLQFLHPGCAVVQITNSFFLHADEPVTIDGTTQTAFTGDTNPDGWEVAIFGATLRLNGPDQTIVGFHSTGVAVNGTNALVQGLTGGGNVDVFGGSGSLIQGNELGTLKIDRSNDNVVVGNTLRRVRIWGFGSAQLATDNRVGGPDPADRNWILGFGSYNSEGLPSGHAIQLFDTQGTLVENNSIGTTVDGLASGSSACTIGISFEGQNHGTRVVGNFLAGILGIGLGPHHAGQLFGYAVLFSGTGSDVELVGNTIGLDSTGAPSLGSVWGISIGDAVTNPASYTDLRIGGGGPGEGNVIAGHLLNGVTIGRNVPQVRLAGNAVHSNGWLAVDLIPTGFGYGVTPNDPLDADTGGNGLQNFPEVATARQLGSTVRVQGALQSTPSSSFTLEFFASQACDPSGNGQAELFLGRTSIATDAAGDATFDATLPAAPPAGWVVTATATAEPEGRTSELSACVPVVPLTCQTDLGFSGPGVGVLTLCGDPLATGGQADLAVSGVPAFAPVWIVASGASQSTALFSGTLVPALPAFVLLRIANGQGEVHLPVAGGAPAPTDLFVQALYFDALLPGSIGFTNALQALWLP